LQLGENYIDAAKLTKFKGSIPNFQSYDEVSPVHDEPYGIIFQIVGKDSLVTVKREML
jgi:hypothetical protein